MIAILLGTFGQVILSFISVKLATAILSVEAYGQISLFSALYSVFSLTLLNPVGMFFNRKLHFWINNGKINYYFWLYIGYLLLVSLFVALLLIVASHFNIVFIKKINLFWLVIVVCSSVFFSTSNVVIISFVNQLGKRWSFMLLTFFTALLSLILSLILVTWITPGAVYWQLGQIGGQAIIVLCASFLFSKFAFNPTLYANKLTKKNFQNVLFFCIPVAISVGLVWVQTQSYRFIVGEKIGLATLGIFYAGYSIGSMIIITFETVVTTYFLPKFYREISACNSKNYVDIWQKYGNAVLPSLFLTAIFSIIFSSELTRLLLSDKFQIAAKYVMWGALVETGRVIASTFAYLTHAKMKTKELILPYFIGAIISFALVYLLVPIFGISAVGYSLVLSSLSVIVVMQLTIVKGIPLGFYWGSLAKSSLYSIVFLFLVLLIKRLFPFHLNFVNAFLTLIGFGFLYLIFTYNLLRGSLRI